MHELQSKKPFHLDDHITRGFIYLEAYLMTHSLIEEKLLVDIENRVLRNIEFHLLESLVIIDAINATI